MRRSILTEKIARRGRHILQEYTVDPLDFLQAGDVMTPAPETLDATMPAGDAIAFFTERATHRSYPVVDAEGRLSGLMSRSDALRWQTDGLDYRLPLGELLSDASQPAAFVETPIGKVADLMIETGIGRIPIVESDSGRVVGILSRHDLLKARSIRRREELLRLRRSP